MDNKNLIRYSNVTINCHASMGKSENILLPEIRALDPSLRPVQAHSASRLHPRDKQQQQHAPSRLILLLALAAASLARVLPLCATRAAAAEGRREGKVNVLLAVDPDQERWNIHHLLAHPAIESQSQIVSTFSVLSITGCGAGGSGHEHDAET